MEKIYKQNDGCVQSDNQWNFEMVLGDEYCVNEKSIGLRRVIAAPIKDKKYTQNILRCLEPNFPFKLPHVKRVKRELNSSPAKLHVVLFIEHIHSKQFDQVMRNSCDINLSCVDTSLSCIEEFIDDLYVANLPTKPPLTRKQFEFTKQFWPVSFHEDKNLESIISGVCYDKKEIFNTNNFLKKAVECGINSNNNIDCSTGAVIVDPKLNKIICKVSSSEVKHKLLHGPMIAIDLIAKHQGGGTYRKEFNGIDGLYCSEKTEGDYYIGTNMHVYLSHEPCVMCSMALLHSRVARVVYAQPNAQGGLGTLYKIHAVKDMNHKFLVYKLKT